MSNQKAISNVMIVDDRAVATLSSGEELELAMEYRTTIDQYGQRHRIETFKERNGNKIVPVGSVMSSCFFTDKTRKSYK